MPKPPLPKGKAKDKRIDVRFNQNDYSTFKNYCSSQGFSPSEVIRSFVQECLENNQKHKTNIGKDGKPFAY
jgi:predicted DNA binding CopG/RHH family protein